MATFYAGENMVINTNYPTNGEFYAGHFYSGTSLSSDGKTELGPGSINDLSKYTGKLPNNLDQCLFRPRHFLQLSQSHLLRHRVCEEIKGRPTIT